MSGLLLYVIQPVHIHMKVNCIYPEVRKFGKNLEHHYIPIKSLSIIQDVSEDLQCLNLHVINDSHSSAYLEQRSRLFICVETNRSRRRESSIAFAVS